MISRKHLNANGLRIIGLDEADELLSIEFIDRIQEIFQLLSDNIQRGLFFSTMPAEILRLTEEFMRDPIRILVKRESELQGIKPYYISIGKEDWKFDTLRELYDDLDIANAIIYCNTRKKVEELAEALAKLDFAVSYIHGDMEHDEREVVMSGFRTGSYIILIGTNILGCGIHYQQISIVINYDMPNNYEKYLHRIARCGRFGRKVVACNFVIETNEQFLNELKVHYNTEIEEMPVNISGILE